jgi:hypothetical protein
MNESFWSLSAVLGVLAIASALALTAWLLLYA